MRVAWRKEMKLGVGLYRYMLKDEEFTFARQCGCSDVIIQSGKIYYDGENDMSKLRMKRKLRNRQSRGVCLDLDHMMASPEAGKGKGLNIYGI